jgi:gas vesicle protein
MASVPTRTADELTTAIRSLVDRALDAEMREQLAARGREVAAAITEAAGTVAERTSEMATDAWRETKPQRKEAARTAERFQRDALKWGRQAWRSQLRPALRNAWKNRTVAIGAAGSAVPVSKELVDQAKIRLGLRRREERHWRSFFLGVVIGAIGGAVVALLTAPRPGREMRDEIVSRARDAAEGAGDWVPLFQRPEVPAAPESVDEAVSAPEPTGNGRERRARSPRTVGPDEAGV